MSRIRVRRSRLVAGLVAAVLASTAGSLAPAYDFSVGLTPAEIQACIAPLGTRSPDVLQGWVDGCRVTKHHAYFGGDEKYHEWCRGEPEVGSDVDPGMNPAGTGMSRSRGCP